MTPKWKTRLLIAGYLFIAFVGEILLFQLLPVGRGDLFIDNLPIAVFVLGVGLAFYTARATFVSLGVPSQSGLYCRKCNYDLRETPGRCPECGAECSGMYRSALSPKERRWQAIAQWVSVVIIAVVAAALIMIHVQIHNAPFSGH